MSPVSPTFMVIFKEGTNDKVIAAARRMVEAHGGKIGHVYDTVLTGFSATMNPSLVDVIKADPHVDYIEVDQEVHIVHEK